MRPAALVVARGAFTYLWVCDCGHPRQRPRRVGRADPRAAVSSLGSGRERRIGLITRNQRIQRDHLAGLITLGQRDGSIRTDRDPERLALVVNAALVGLLVHPLEPPPVQGRLLATCKSLMEDLLR